MEPKKKVVLYTDLRLESELAALIAQYPFYTVVSENPDVVIAYGGDGTYFRAEHAWPGVPKLMLKASEVCKLCAPFSNDEILKKYSEGNYSTESLSLLDVSVKEKILTGINDIIIHNADPRHAIRYDIFVNGRAIGEKGIIGDGIVVATPLGSTGYYRSITDSSFNLGIGLAFNNSTEQSDHIVLAEDASITMCITRGPAIGYVDNQQESILLDMGDEAVIQKSKRIAQLIRIQK